MAGIYGFDGGRRELSPLFDQNDQRYKLPSLQPDQIDGLGVNLAGRGTLDGRLPCAGEAGGLEPSSMVRFLM
jgi:hypothetical protein